MLRVGLTGGIACGKSQVLARMAAQGLHTIDLDVVAREVTAPGNPALQEIAAAFGAEFVAPTGALLRERLAKRVFGDAEARELLNRIVHPRIRAAEARWADTHAGDADGVLVTDAALLVESGSHLRFDRLIVVCCREEQQISRMRARDGFDEETARSRLAAQMPVAEKRLFAHYVLDSTGSQADLARQADVLVQELRALAREMPAGGHPPDPLVAGLVETPQLGPRQLGVERVLKAGAVFDLAGLSRALVPPAAGPWHASGGEQPPGGPVTTPAVALGAWALRAGRDAEAVAAAAASVARLTHAEPGDRTDGSLVALLVHDAAPGAPVRDWAVRARRLERLARRWGGGEVSAMTRAAIGVAERFAGDPVAARVEAARGGGDGALAAVLAGMGTRPGSSPRSTALRSILESVPARER